MFGKEKTPRPSHPWKGLCAGLAGGIVGTLAMTAAQWGMGRVIRLMNEGKHGGVAGEEVAEMEKGEEPATVQAAAVLSEKLFRHELRGERQESAGQAMHYGVGTTIGMGYGLAAEVAPKITSGMGLPFAAALMVVSDEIAVPALGLSPPPRQQPPAIHLYALAAHLVYGAACELTRRQVRGWLNGGGRPG